MFVCSIPKYVVFLCTRDEWRTTGYKKDLLNEWASYFETLLNKTSTTHNHDIPGAETDLEIRPLWPFYLAALKYMKEGKAKSVDNVMAVEVLK